MTFEPEVLKMMIDFYVGEHKNEEDYDPTIEEKALLEIDVLLGKCTPDGETIKPGKADFGIELEPYKGKISFHLLDYIRALDDSTKEDLISDGGWWSFISDAMIHDIKHGFSYKNYNSRIYEIRQAIMRSEVMPGVLSKLIEAILDEVKSLQRYEDKYRDAYHAIWRSSFMDENEDLKKFVNALDVKFLDTPHVNEKEVKEAVDNFLKLTGILDEIDKYRETEEKILAERDPEAAARVIECERRRKESMRRY